MSLKFTLNRAVLISCKEKIIFVNSELLGYHTDTTKSRKQGTDFY